MTDREAKIIMSILGIVGIVLMVLLCSCKVGPDWREDAPGLKFDEAATNRMKQAVLLRTNASIAPAVHLKTLSVVRPPINTNGWVKPTNSITHLFNPPPAGGLYYVEASLDMENWYWRAPNTNSIITLNVSKAMPQEYLRLHYEPIGK